VSRLNFISQGSTLLLDDTACFRVLAVISDAKFAGRKHTQTTIGRKRSGNAQRGRRGVSFCTRSILHGRLARFKQAILPIDFGSWGWPMVDGAGCEFQQDLSMGGLRLHANFDTGFD
jgi:hypothetical protein